MSKFVLRILCLLMCGSAFSGPGSNFGRQFLISLNADFVPSGVKIVIYAKNDVTSAATVKVSWPKDQGSLSLTYTVQAGEMTKLGVNDMNNAPMCSATETMCDKGILVESTQDVAVLVATTPGHCYTPVLPAEALGHNHIVLTNLKNSNSKTLYSVMALYSCTKVKIYGDSSTEIFPERMLNAYEIFQVISEKDQTGTRIRADKPVAVFAGDADSTWQILPVGHWGQTYVFYSQESVGKRYFKVLSAEADTLCTISGSEDNGKTSSSTISKQGTIIPVSQITKMECSHEVLVAELKGSHDESVSESSHTGQSILSLFPAATHFLDDFQLVFWTSQYSVTICIPSGNVETLRVDGKAPVVSPIKIATISGYDIFSFGTSFEGVHSFSHSTVKFGLTATFEETNNEAKEFVSYSNAMFGLQKYTQTSATANSCQDETTTTAASSVVQTTSTAQTEMSEATDKATVTSSKASSIPTDNPSPITSAGTVGPFGESGGGGSVPVTTMRPVIEADPLIKTKYLAIILGVCGGVPFLIVGCVALHAIIASRLSRRKEKRTVNPVDMAEDLSE